MIIKKNVAPLFLVCKFAINIFVLYLRPVYMEVGGRLVGEITRLGGVKK